MGGRLVRMSPLVVVVVLLTCGLPTASSSSAWLCVDVPPPVICQRIQERVEEAVDTVMDPEPPEPRVPGVPDPSHIQWPDVPDAPDLPDPPGVPDPDDLPLPEPPIEDPSDVVALLDKLTCDRLPAYLPLAPILIHPIVREALRQAGLGNTANTLNEEIEGYSYPRERCEAML